MKLSNTNIKWIIVTIVSILLVIACAPPVPPTAGPSSNAPSVQTQQQELEKKINSREAAYQPVNLLDYQNYNSKQKITDDPNTIMWCTYYPSNPNVKPFTTGYVGKTTSSGKRPFPTTQTRVVGESGGDYAHSWDVTYNPELPQPDQMYGTSAEYKYGFTPAGVYNEVEGIETSCSNELTTYAQNHTDISISVDPATKKTQNDAEAALKAGDAAKALELLKTLETK
jgi:hypothetical protein